MPALHLFGTRWESSTDQFSLYALLLLIYHIIWFLMYGIGLWAFTAPQECPTGPTDPQEYVGTYVLLFIYTLWLVMAAVMLIISLRGAPFEPSKRRWLVPLIYAYLLSWIPGWGCIGYMIYVLYGIEDTCWNAGGIHMIALMTFGAMGILAGIAFTIFTTHILFLAVRPGRKLDQLKKAVSTGVGCYTWLVQRHRGPLPPLEELATEYFEKHGNALDLDKSDVVTALICARLLQRERRQAVLQGRLAAAGELKTAEGSAAPASNGSQQQQQQGEDAELAEWIRAVCKGGGTSLTPSAMALHLAPQLTLQEAAAICTDSKGAADGATLRDALHWARYAAAAFGKQGYLWTHEGTGQLAAGRQLSRLAKEARRAGAVPRPAAAGPVSEAAKPVPEARLAEDYVAAREVLGLPDGAIVCVSPGDEERARLGYIVALDRERRCVVVAVSGQRQYMRMADKPVPLPKGWAAGLPQEAAAEDAEHVVHAGALVAVQHLLGDLEAGGLLALLLPPSAAAAPPALKPDCASAPEQQKMEGTGASNGSQQGGLSPAPVTAAAVDAVATVLSSTSSSSDGLACTGWSLVLTGHGQGAGAAVLLGLALLPCYPGLRVWAFNPPGGLVSPALSRALAPATVSVMLGKDAVPRTSEAAVAALVQEGMVGLARFRYNKGLMVVALIAEKAGPRSWRGRWLNPARALHPPGAIPPEPLEHLARFHAALRAQQQAESPPAAAGLPGRVLYLRRLKPLGAAETAAAAASAAADGSTKAAQGSVAASQMEAGSVRSAGSAAAAAVPSPGCCGGCCGGCIPLCTAGCCAGCCCSGSGAAKRESGKVWDAVWVSPEAVAGEGILVSKRSITDHFVSRLVAVLRRLGG